MRSNARSTFYDLIASLPIMKKNPLNSIIQSTKDKIWFRLLCNSVLAHAAHIK